MSSDYVAREGGWGVVDGTWGGDHWITIPRPPGDCDDKETEMKEGRRKGQSIVLLSRPMHPDLIRRSRFPDHTLCSSVVVPVISLSQYHIVAWRDF